MPLYMTRQGEMTTTLGSSLDKRWWMRLLLCSNALEIVWWRIFAIFMFEMLHHCCSTHFQAAPWAKGAMYYNSTVCSNRGLIPGAHHRQVWYLNLLPLIFLPLGTTFRRRIYILLIGDFELLCSPMVVPCMNLGNGHWEHREPKRLNGIHHLLSK
jgi:hypothetical protein